MTMMIVMVMIRDTKSGRSGRYICAIFSEPVLIFELCMHAPVLSAQVLPAPMISAPVISAPMPPTPVLSAPVISKPVQYTSA